MWRSSGEGNVVRGGVRAEERRAPRTSSPRRTPLLPWAGTRGPRYRPTRHPSPSIVTEGRWRGHLHRGAVIAAASAAPRATRQTVKGAGKCALQSLAPGRAHPDTRNDIPAFDNVFISGDLSFSICLTFVMIGRAQTWRLLCCANL